jgi:hypothetical protein
MLTACGDDESEPTYNTVGGLGGASGGSGAGPDSFGGAATSAGTFSASTAGTFSTAGAAGSAAGSSGAGGNGSSGGSAGGGGSGGSPGPVYTIQGCEDAATGGAGGATDGAGGVGGGADGAGGATDGSGGSGGNDGGAGGADGSPSLPGFFASFSLYDCVTDKPVQTCVDKVDDFVVNVTGDAPLTVLANIAPGVGPASVIFTYDGVPQPAHNLFPYALGEDDNGDYQKPTPPLTPGVHDISIAAYDKPDGLGKVIGRASIVLTVADGT